MLIIAETISKDEIMKVLSLNCRNCNRDMDRRSPYFWKDRMEVMEEMIRRERPDVMCLQELIFPATMFIPEDYRRVGFSISHHIYVRKDLKAKAGKFRIHWNSAMVEGVKVICVHGHWKKCKCADLCADLREEMVGPSIAMGDFNVPAGTLMAHGMPWSSRRVLGMDPVDTFQNFTKPESHGEIDHSFMIGMRPKAYGVLRGGPVRMSDHYPIVVEFDAPKGRR